MDMKRSKMKKRKEKRNRENEKVKKAFHIQPIELLECSMLINLGPKVSKVDTNLARI